MNELSLTIIRVAFLAVLWKTEQTRALAAAQ
mgnify:CR=1 FL=1